MSHATTTRVNEEHVGQMVRYYDEGWRFATLLEVGPKWCSVQHPKSGRVKVAIEDVQLWEEV